MDSDDEQFDLPDIPAAHSKVFGEIDLSEIMSSGSGILNLPEVLETEVAEAEGAPTRPKFHRTMWNKMDHAYLNEKDRDVLSTMIGDFDEIETRMEDIGNDGRVKKVIIRPGTGRMLEDGDVASIHYIMTCEDGDEPFDSTYTGFGHPKRFRVSGEGSIALMGLALPTMRIGEIAKFLGTHEVGFGKIGIPHNGILPESRILMQVEVMEVCVRKQDFDVLSMTADERQELPFETLIKTYEELKTRGNREYTNGKFADADYLYKELYEGLQHMNPFTEAQRHQLRELTVKLFNNMCLNYCKMKKLKRALQFAEKGTKVQGLSNLRMAKPFYLCAKVQLELGETEAAYRDIKKAFSYVPDADIRALKLKIEDKMKKDAAEERERCYLMMQNSAITSATDSAEVARATSHVKTMNILNLLK